jgi:superfamily II DNA or RNA helicase
VLAQWPDERIVILTHVRELISQNFAELLRLWPEAPAGIYSAGLNRRDVQAQILFAGIQSVHRKAYAIQRADLVLVDEVHLVPRSANTSYRHFLGDLSRINPRLKIIGLTATPYRLDSGMLHTGPDALFDDIAFEVSVRELIDDGYLAPLISKQTSTQLDVSGVGTRGGEFIAGQLKAAVDQDPITQAADQRGRRLRPRPALVAAVLRRRRPCAARLRRRARARLLLRDHLRAHAQGRARSDHRRIQAGRGPGAGLDGRADHGFQCAGPST